MPAIDLILHDDGGPGSGLHIDQALGAKNPATVTIRATHEGKLVCIGDSISGQAIRITVFGN